MLGEIRIFFFFWWGGEGNALARENCGGGVRHAVKENSDDFLLQQRPVDENSMPSRSDSADSRHFQSNFSEVYDVPSMAFEILD